jgi:hypothetical protein
MTLAERLLAGEHHGCATWQDVAARLRVDERHLRAVRKILAGKGTPVGLVPDREGSAPKTLERPVREEKPLAGPESAQHKTKPTVQFCERDKWPTVADFDAGKDFLDEVLEERPGVAKLLDYRNPEMLPYEQPANPLTRKLTREECPDGTTILWASDIHIPIHNVAACRLMLECAERIGVSRVIVGGDGYDFNCLSQHAKEAHRTVEHGTLLEEIEPGRELVDWFAKRPTQWILGNHEHRLKRFIDNNPAFHGSLLGNFSKIVDLPSSIEVVPQGGEVRLGNLSLRHLDAEFKNSGGGKYPAQRILDMLPDQSTGGGHVHRISQARRTTRDEDGILRTRCAWTFGHLSNEHDHLGYMPTVPNWQTGFGVITVWWEGERPRWNVYQVEVLFDRYGRPYFELWGRLYHQARQVAA